MRPSIRIVVVGDSGVGKTSLITSFLREGFEPEVAHVLPEISIPGEVTADRVQTHIIDTSGSETDKQTVATELSLADVVCLVYSVSDASESDSCFRRLSTYWLPFIRNTTKGKLPPVILVGNKIDEIYGDSDELVKRKVVPFMNDNKEIETSIECSAKEMLNVAEVFYFASKAVLHPTAPLYDTTEHNLKPKARDALKRIFTICDRNKDGLLSDDELNAFQRYVFGSPLQVQELEGVKQVVRENISNGVVKNSLTQDGFVYLHLLFVQRGRMETIWSVLRKFGYNSDVELRNDYLNPNLPMPSFCATELSPKAFQFLTELFQLYDRDNDGHLNDDDLKLFFQTTPGLPWKSEKMNYVSSGYMSSGEMSLHQFYGMWAMLTIMNYKLTLQYLAYLGYYHHNYTTSSAKEAIKILPMSSRKSKMHYNERSVFHGLVFGAIGSGKTEFVKGLADVKFINKYQPESKPFVGVNSLDVKGFEKYLILEEVKTEDSFNVLRDSPRLSQADFLCFVYDTSDPSSFSYLSNLRKYFALDKYPIVFIATKNDMGAKIQDADLQPEEYTKSISLAAPLMASMTGDELSKEEVYNVLIGVAMNPSVAIPFNAAAAQQRFRILVGVTLVVGMLSVGGILAYKIYKTKHGSSG